jgi:outer membrane receptor for ferrienterochelin and colicins
MLIIFDKMNNKAVFGSVIYASMLSILILAGSNSALAQAVEVNKEEVITVTATRTKLNLDDAPASVSVITAHDLELSASVDVLDAVRQTPGISFQGRGFGGRQTLSIRGMGREQTLFMIDGRRVLGTDSIFTHSNFQYDWIPLNSIKSIEVVRGPMSALYGSDALGGVINIITKPTPKAWTGTVAARYTLAKNKGDEQYAGLYASGPVGEKIGVLLSYSYNDVQDVPFKANPLLSELEGKRAHNLYGRFTLDLTPAHHFNVDLGVGQEDRFRNTMNRGRPPVFESSFDLDRLQYGAGYNGEYGKATAQINYNHAALDRVNVRTNGVPSSVPQTFKNDALDGHIVVPVGTAHRFVVGGEYRRETLVHSAIPKGQGSLDLSGVFIQDEWRFSDALMLTTGLRYDSHQNFGSEFSPRAYLLYHLNENWTIKGGYGHGFKSPTIKQSLQDYRFVGPFTFVGNADVGPETSDNFEISSRYKTGKMRLAVTGFVNQVNDLISTRCIGNCSSRFGRVLTFVNEEQTQTKGIETEVEFDVTPAVTLVASHVYMKAKNIRTGLRLAERPDHVFNAKLSWRIDNPGITLMVRAAYNGDQIEYDARGRAVDLPGYMLWYAQGSWDINDRLQMEFGVKNLADLSLAEKSPNYSFAERQRGYYLGLRRDF